MVHAAAGSAGQVAQVLVHPPLVEPIPDHEQVHVRSDNPFRNRGQGEHSTLVAAVGQENQDASIRFLFIRPDDPVQDVHGRHEAVGQVGSAGPGFGQAHGVGQTAGDPGRFGQDLGLARVRYDRAPLAEAEPFDKIACAPAHHGQAGGQVLPVVEQQNVGDFPVRGREGKRFDRTGVNALVFPQVEMEGFESGHGTARGVGDGHEKADHRRRRGQDGDPVGGQGPFLGRDPAREQRRQEDRGPESMEK